MIFYTVKDCESWVEGHGLQAPDKAALKNFISYPKEAYRYYEFAKIIAEKLFSGDEVLLVLNEWSIWSSVENLHLYYRLRNSYHDFKLMYNAPGHLFLKHEKEDLISFFQISMLNGWGGYMTTQGCDFGVFFSHDDFVALYGENQEAITEFESALNEHFK